MGRTLPWKKQGSASGAREGARRTAFARTNDDVTSSPREGPSPSNPLTPRPRARVSTTSPSPLAKTEPAQDALDDGFGQEIPALPATLMISGLQHDDKWRMVEDEFVAMAHKLTAHLHAAEYQRLKKAAQAQNADAIQSLSRPVTAPMTGRVKRRQTVVSLQKSQLKGIRRALSRTQDAEQDEVDELPWAGTNLEGLMDSPRKSMVPLTKMISTASGTRAAALSRKDSMPSPKGSCRSDSIQQAHSPITTRKRSVRFSQEQQEQEESFETHSVPWPPSPRLSTKPQSATKTPSSPNHTLRMRSSTAQGRAVTVSLPVDGIQKPAPAPVSSNVGGDSDSSVETMFGQHFRQRRKKSRVE
ncbi:hypothetical protein N0V82_002449 [Gnomoniopsis sp. IMI 355080]|nr:hypothetical protein N0V82_002449 [Gnomoniopsis sp. IMI 355080]